MLPIEPIDYRIEGLVVGDNLVIGTDFTRSTGLLVGDVIAQQLTQGNVDSM